MASVDPTCLIWQVTRRPYATVPKSHAPLSLLQMYASDTARGGVLEPAGIAEIKFRKNEVVKQMQRLDSQLRWMSMNEASGVVTQEDIQVAAVVARLLLWRGGRCGPGGLPGFDHSSPGLQARVAELMPYYTPIGEIFADLHDRPERMLAKGVIRSIVSWKGARTYFYWRIKRRVRAPPVRAQAAPPAPPRPAPSASRRRHMRGVHVAKLTRARPRVRFARRSSSRRSRRRWAR